MDHSFSEFLKEDKQKATVIHLYAQIKETERHFFGSVFSLIEQRLHCEKIALCYKNLGKPVYLYQNKCFSANKTASVRQSYSAYFQQKREDSIPFMHQDLVLAVLFIEGSSKEQHLQIQDLLVLISCYIQNSDLSQRLLKCNFFDQLTRLANRNQYYFDFDSNCLSSQSLGFIILDVDNLKWMNDQYGHLYGDSILERIGLFLNRLQNDHITCYRVGGDEFIVLYHNCSEEEASSFYSQLHASLPRAIEGATNVSAGWSYQLSPFDRTKLYQDADEMMYREKKKKKQK